jgi:hypothetical protein
MMSATLPLRGLERFMEVCQRNALPWRREPAVLPAPAAGSLVAGLPLDPVLAAVYTRVDFIGIKEGFELFRTQPTRWLELLRDNEDWRRDRPAPFDALLVFGKESALATYYATVPALADAAGRQPVVEVDIHEEPYAIPLASDVDHFFDTYSRYWEALIAEPDYVEEGPGALTFPFGVPELAARDEALVRMLGEGRFDFLGVQKDRSIREWIQKVRALG